MTSKVIDSTTNRVLKETVLQPVKVRKYKVDVEQLGSLLRKQKQSLNLSNKEIAEKLDKKESLVEHWFRKDKYFAIPDAGIWFNLKRLLQITTARFDKVITEFEYRDGVYDMAERVYYDTGIAPTLTTVNTDVKVILSS